MTGLIFGVTSLLLGIGVLLIGHGLAGTLLSLRATVEGYPEFTIGLIMAAYFAGYIMGTFKCPALINRIGHIRVFTIAAAVASSLIIVHGLLVNPWVWLGVRFIYGACIVAIYLVIESWLNARAGNEFRGRVFAIYMLVNLLTLALGQQLLLIGEVIKLELFAIAAIFFSISLVPVAWTRIQEPGRVDTPAVDIRKLLHTAPVGFASCLAAGLVGGVFWTMGPLYGLKSGLTEPQVAAFMSITMLGGAIFQWPVGHLSDRIDRRKILIAVSLCAAIFAAISTFIGLLPYWLILTAMFFFGGSYFCIYSISIAHSNDMSDPNDFVTLSSTLLLIYGVGATIGPLTVGLLIQMIGIESLPLFYVLCLGSLTAYVWYKIKRISPATQEEKVEFIPMMRTSTISQEAHLPDYPHDTNPSDINNSVQVDQSKAT